MAKPTGPTNEQDAYKTIPCRFGVPSDLPKRPHIAGWPQPAEPYEAFRKFKELMRTDPERLFPGLRLPAACEDPDA
jgi:hypothetical protein